MPKMLRHLSTLLLGLLLAACASQPITPTSQHHDQPVPSAAATPLPATQVAAAPDPTAHVPASPATDQPVQPTLVPTALMATPPTSDGQPSAAPTSTAPASLTAGQMVLRVGPDSADGSLGLTEQAGPSTFRVAADGSLRIMDTVNKRLLFYDQGQAGGNGHLRKVIDLADLKRPGDFAVTTVGDVFVLDVDGWALAMYSIDGVLQDITPLHPSLKGLFSTISLTADGSLWGVGQDKHHSLIFDTPDSPADVTSDASYTGAITVRSAAYFSIASTEPSTGQSFLSITNVGDGTPIQFNLGKVDGQANFLDVNQGMEPYIMLQNGSISEIRRYSIRGELLGTLTLDQQTCRPMSRSIYVDRPGDVYSMCVNEQGATITRYAMTDAQGQALPRFDQLVTTAPWSPASLQATPG